MTCPPSEAPVFKSGIHPSIDQFCVYVANRFVIPELRSERLAQFATGEMSLDRLTKAYVRERLEYQYAVVAVAGAISHCDAAARVQRLGNVPPKRFLPYDAHNTCKRIAVPTQGYSPLRVVLAQ